jgi:uncharacterized membrane protein
VTDQADGSGTPVHHIVIAPNQSLSALALVGLYCGGVVLSLLIATVLAWLGFWPILVFAVMEWLGVGVCLWAMRRGGRYREIITVTANQVTVEKLNRSGLETVASFQRHWASVERQATGSWLPSRLVIKSHGTMCEVGRCLTEDERRSLTARLQQLIGPVNRTPDWT